MMNTYTIAVKSKDRASGTPANFIIKFGQVLPNDKTVFKCRVSGVMINVGSMDGSRDPNMVNVNGGDAFSLALVADFPFINYFSTSGNLQPIALIDNSTHVQPQEFIISNINQQSINFKFTDTGNVDASAAIMTETFIILTFEAL